MERKEVINMNVLKIGGIVLTVLGGIAGIGGDLISKKLRDETIKEEVAKQIAELTTKK